MKPKQIICKYSNILLPVSFLLLEYLIWFELHLKKGQNLKTMKKKQLLRPVKASNDRTLGKILLKYVYVVLGCLSGPIGILTSRQERTRNKHEPNKM